MTYRVPQHEVDQVAAALRDSGAPAATTKAVADAFAGSARGVERIAAKHPGVTMTLEQVAAMLRAMGEAFTATADQQERGSDL